VQLRYKPAVNTVCRFDATNGEPQEPAIVWNISTSGICILSPELHPVGAVLNCSLGITGDDYRRPVTLRVVHCRQLESGEFALGARFERPLTDEELKPFVDEG
jgi:hypothetical protein